MKELKVAVLVTLIFLTGLKIKAQEIQTIEDAFFEAEYFMFNNEYADALPYYLDIISAMPDNANIEYRIGLCYLNIDGKKNLAIDYLERAVLNLTAKYRSGSLKQTAAPYEALYYLGDAYRINYMFDKAKAAYQRYRETLLADDAENIAFTEQQIACCTNAPKLMEFPVQFTLEPLGNMINDSKDNYSPVVSADGRSIVYMTALKFYNAIMLAKMVKGAWAPPINITPELQLGEGKLSISCLSSTSGLLLLTIDDGLNSEIWISKFDGVRWSPVSKLKKGINTKYKESHGYVTDDGKKLVFASDRPGGFGGMDLYMSELDATGEWGTPVNMGPEINTPFNEDNPFLLENGKILFFSSQGHFNMGGYDFFHSEIRSNGLWSKPVNIGYPLNTPDDDAFFCPSGDGKSGYISLVREGGAGKNDIYKIIFK